MSSLGSNEGSKTQTPLILPEEVKRTSSINRNNSISISFGHLYFDMIKVLSKLCRDIWLAKVELPRYEAFPCPTEGTKLQTKSKVPSVG